MAAQTGLVAAIAQRGHWHEAMIGLPPPSLGAQLVHHEAEAPFVTRQGGRGLTFSARHFVGEDFEAIPIPGHTAGATAYLWNTGAHRLLFTGGTLYVRKGKWGVAVLEDSSRERYVESLELIRELDFDVLVPWVAGADDRIPTWCRWTPPNAARTSRRSSGGCAGDPELLIELQMSAAG